MAVIRPFQGIRPALELVRDIAALPYDVYSSQEARKIVEKNPRSFLKIDRAETQFPEGINIYAPQVYEKAAETLRKMRDDGEFVQDSAPCYYIYSLTMDGRAQTGLMCCASADDYLNQVIKKHENTREDKEQDRIRHVDVCSAHTGPIFLIYRTNEEVQRSIRAVTEGAPLYDFTGDDGILHQMWKVEDAGTIAKLTDAFANVESLYVADGHHRAASAVKVALKRREENPGYTGEEEFNYFLSVLFPEEQLKIYDYNRVVHNIGDKAEDTVLIELEKSFQVDQIGDTVYKPQKKGEVGMYLKGCGYRLTVRPEAYSFDPVEGLDVSILQNEVLCPIFGIQNPKTDERMEFVGGIRGLEVLKEIVDNEEGAAAFAMYPTSLEELLRVADAGRLMPPKSTWFEPKLRSGMVIHEF
ncbi:MAG: DUF1015 domain-containing protein [Coprococcus sp.]|nr:DUF1015 domain-containing protein [Coprococcus sp.]